MPEPGTSRNGTRICLVGCGRWGRHILRDLKSLGCAVTAVARSEASRRRAAGGDADAVVPTLAAAGDVDGYVVSTPTRTHTEVLDELVESGLPIFVEKPLTSDPAAAERLAARAGERLFVMDKWRYHGGVEALGEIARGGELGEVVGLRTWRLGWGRTHVDVDAAWHLAPHELAIGLEVLGRLPPPRAARASAWDGEVTHMVGVLGDSPWQVFEVSHAHPGNLRRVSLECAGGTAVLADSYSEHLEIYRPPLRGRPEEAVEKRPIPTEMPLLRELRAFVEHLRGGPPPRSSAAEGLAVVRAIAELGRLAGAGP